MATVTAQSKAEVMYARHKHNVQAYTTSDGKRQIFEVEASLFTSDTGDVAVVEPAMSCGCAIRSTANGVERVAFISVIHD